MSTQSGLIAWKTSSFRLMTRNRVVSSAVMYQNEARGLEEAIED